MERWKLLRVDSTCSTTPFLIKQMVSSTYHFQEDKQSFNIAIKFLSSFTIKVPANIGDNGNHIATLSV